MVIFWSKQGVLCAIALGLAYTVGYSSMVMVHGMSKISSDSSGLLSALNQLFEGFDGVYESMKERPVERNSEYNFVAAFDVANQMTRPYEFLNTMLDLIRVNYEPYPLGSMLLNANLCFLAEMLDQSPTSVGYVSVVSNEGESFVSFWDTKVVLHLANNGYDNSAYGDRIVICSAGQERYGPELFTEVSEHLGIGLKVDDAKTLLREGRIEHPNNTVGGYCLDDSLGGKIRVSMLLMGSGNQTALMN